jgi:hypothetical protein
MDQSRKGRCHGSSSLGEVDGSDENWKSSEGDVSQAMGTGQPIEGEWRGLRELEMRSIEARGGKVNDNNN